MISGFFFRLMLALPPALMCGLQNNDLFVPICTLLLLIPFLLTKKRLSATILHCAMLIILAASFAFLPVLTGSSATGTNYSDLRFFLPLCCYCAALFLYLDNVLPACITEIIVFLLLARPGVPVNSLFRSGMIPENIFFAIVVFISAAAAILLFSEKAPGNKNAIRLRFTLLLLPLPVLMIYFNHLYRENFRLFRSWDLRGKFYALRQYNKPEYINRGESDLNRPFRRDPEFKKRILLYAESETAPGYLKSNTFERYRRGIWSKPYAVGEELTGSLKDYTSVFMLSAEPELAENQKTITVYPVEYGLFNHVPLPENCYSVELVAEKVSQMPWGDLTPWKWDKRAAYTAKYAAGNTPGARELVLPDEKCLYVPRSLRYPLSRLLGNQGGILDGPPIQNDRELAMRVVAFLQSNYKYSLTPPDPGQNRYNRHHDPIFRFLFADKAGHCELFASACTMLLRSAGLHARYVTGFVCRRKLADTENIWVSTGFDSHAWTEVYLPDERRWIRVDATPYSDSMEIVVEDATLQNRFTLLKNKIIAYFRNGRFLNLWDNIEEHPWQYLLLLPIAALLVFLLVLTGRRRKKNYAPKVSRTKRLAAKVFLKQTRKVMRKTGIRRKKDETFREWLARLDETSRNELLPALHQYEKQRFSD